MYLGREKEGGGRIGGGEEKEGGKGVNGGGMAARETWHRRLAERRRGGGEKGERQGGSIPLSVRQRKHVQVQMRLVSTLRRNWERGKGKEEMEEKGRTKDGELKRQAQESF